MKVSDFIFSRAHRTVCLEQTPFLLLFSLFRWGKRYRRSAQRSLDNEEMESVLQRRAINSFS